ncbi:LolA family protein [Pseudoalteromonas denitrificans]|uniref:Outer membrane lipoprotein-sorting protein n=1 Tax=Pseudoalteromonas denitrificans DSM 6059 TaxID=1123010 RepID=A0A1I1I7Z6_9GAMM|nr:outer membrane lipoprotein carrier protein LolA [Pseudoalteromonas denitrificans]SFC30368.1 Outer membrane lipoprotein-sorting protein [Pseudoalteromonas denitrificans DSM 6059]
MLLKHLSYLFLLIIGSLSFSSTAASNESSEKNLMKPNLIAGTFEQNKFFKILTRPIKSSGDFYLDQKLGFYWQTIKPVNSAIFLKSGELMEKDHHGNIKSIVGGGTLASVLIKAISGDINALKNEFELLKHQGNDCLELKPKQEILRQAITKIDICGGLKPESIKLFESKGNKTEIQLTYHENAIMPEAIRAQLQ